MDQLLEEVLSMHFSEKKELYLKQLDQACKIISSNLIRLDKALLENDFIGFKNRGRFLVNNTFSGGIIFLREPETIVEIRMKFKSNSNKCYVAVEYGSAVRNARNVKYKPEAGKIEDLFWNMELVFSNYLYYDRNTQILLIALLGKITKDHCEYEHQHSWFLKYERDFKINLSLDGNVFLQIPVFFSKK